MFNSKKKRVKKKGKNERWALRREDSSGERRNLRKDCCVVEKKREREFLICCVALSILNVSAIVRWCHQDGREDWLYDHSRQVSICWNTKIRGGILNFTGSASQFCYILKCYWVLNYCSSLLRWLPRMEHKDRDEAKSWGTFWACLFHDYQGCDVVCWHGGRAHHGLEISC